MKRCALLLALFSLTPIAHAGAPRFPPGAAWSQDISSADLHPNSTPMIATLQALGGWGMAGGVNNRFHIDFSIIVTEVPAGQNPPNVPVVQHADYQDYYSPDCETPGTTIPFPANAAFEDDGDGDPRACDNEDNDCHLIVVKDRTLYEVYSGDYDGAQIDALCLVKWNLDVVYPPQGRGEHCTSADAAGFPIAALLPNADDVALAVSQGGTADLGHAIRFILPNARMASFPDGPDNDNDREPLYVRPASHAGGPVGPEASVPYGARLRLRNSFPVAGYSAGAQVIIRTMQRYGIVLSDGGNIPLTFASDANTTAKWANLGITPQVFWSGAPGARTPIMPTDFDVIDTGARIEETYDCVPTVLPAITSLFKNGFE